MSEATAPCDAPAVPVTKKSALRRLSVALQRYWASVTRPSTPEEQKFFQEL